MAYGAYGFFSSALTSVSACILVEKHQAWITPLSTSHITGECAEVGLPTAAVCVASQPLMETEIQGFFRDISWLPSPSPHLEKMTQVTVGYSCHPRVQKMPRRS